MQRAHRFLEAVFWFALLTHGLGLLCMAFLLVPGLPVDGNSLLERLKFLSSHELSWRLGWLTWQLSALSDLLIALAFLKTALPKWLSFVVLVTTVCALIPDQYGQFLWTTQLPGLATQALSTGQTAKFVEFEHFIYMMVTGWASILYTILAVAWTVALSRLFDTGSKFIRISYALWLLSFVCSFLILLQEHFKLPFILLEAANAVFFTGLMLWFCWVIDLILSKERAVSSWGRMSPWVVPKEMMLAGLIQLCGESKFLRRLFEFIPPVSLASEIDGVLYINYLLPADTLISLVPKHLELQRLGPNKDLALFSILCFEHKNFGPKFFGPLRKLMPGGVVSNWRIHVTEPRSGLSGIYFLSNATNKIAISLGARLLSEAMPMHLADSAFVEIKEKSVLAKIKPGTGSSPDLEADLHLSDNASISSTLPAEWLNCFGSLEAFLNYCVPQERAISSQEFLNRICFQEINLNIDINSCKLLAGHINSKAAESIAGKAEALCFRTGPLNFKFEREHYAKIEESPMR
jgi:hypothetical protein